MNSPIWTVSRAIWRLLPVGIRQHLRSRIIALASRLSPHDGQPPMAESGKTRDCAIVATPHTHFVARLIERELVEAGYSVAILPNATGAASFSYCFAICPHMFENLPLGTVGLQMEQLHDSRWRTDEYNEQLRSLDAVIEVFARNVQELLDRNIPYNRIFYVPLGPLPGYGHYERGRGKTTEVLFYGAINSARRKQLLEALAAEFSVEVVSDLFGKQMREKIAAARVVVNLHYYDDANLESTRIFECLSLGTPVVSEDCIDAGDYPELDGVVDFVPAGNAAALAAAIRRLLVDDRAYADRVAAIEQMNARATRFSSYFRRFMLARRMMTFQRFATTALAYRPALPAFPKICLTLPETPARRQKFAAAHPDFLLFNGLRFHPSWQGCAMSYKYLFSELAAADVEMALIAEDDAEFGPDHDERLSIVMDYLAAHNGEWDVFSGFIAHLDDGVKVSRVDDYGGEKFIWLDRAVSTVFNIYSRQAIRRLAAWDVCDTNVETNTVDRFMERSRLRFVTTAPFLVGHDHHVDSTLWGFQNSHYQPMVDAAIETIAAKAAGMGR